ncbi:hypothetical protein F5Y16DRAFT_64462 [Xylariaceae sp. FL0255]|nr:hypothetical protein F5Y16DRAFT_64462 [Xylariaceae sp. FL0255]
MQAYHDLLSRLYLLLLRERQFLPTLGLEIFNGMEQPSFHRVKGFGPRSTRTAVRLYYHVLKVLGWSASKHVQLAGSWRMFLTYFSLLSLACKNLGRVSFITSVSISFPLFLSKAVHSRVACGHISSSSITTPTPSNIQRCRMCAQVQQLLRCYAPASQLSRSKPNIGSLPFRLSSERKG